MKEKACKLLSLKRSMFMLLLLALTSLSAFAEERTITGTVTDANGPVIGAAVKVSGTTIGTITDIDGNYTFKVPENVKTLEISFVGDETKTVSIKGGRADATLKEQTYVLTDVVAQGYQTVKKRDLVTSIASVGADQIRNMPVTTAGEAMQGKLSGVSVTTTEGAPDADVKIRVRGGTSLTQSNDPLYIVDGFPVSNINDVAPSDIQSMDVLKDAAATAIYGSQGANGVIIITTKDASTDDKDGDCATSFHVDYTGYWGWKKITKTMNLLSARDFALMQYENQFLKSKSNVETKFDAYFDKNYYNEDGSENASYTQTSISDILNTVEGMASTNWQDETFGRTGTNYNNSVTVSGGNKKANFTASYNNIWDKAIMEESQYERDNLSLKAKFQPLSGLTLGFTTRYSKTKVWGAGSNTTDDAGSTTQSRIRNAIQYTPIKLYKVDDGSGDDEEKFGSLYDPLTTISDNYKYKEDVRYSINGYAEYKFLKDWKLRSEIGYDYKHVTTDRFYGTSTYYAQNTGVSGIADGTSSLILTEDLNTKLRNSNTLNYAHKFAKVHNVSVLLGEETLVNEGEENNFYGYGYAGTFSGSEIFNYLGQATTYLSKNYIDPTDNTLSFFARANYDYKGRYYVTGTFRADGSTRFESDNQWGYFPSVALAWRLSDESFMRSFARASKMSNLKVRFSLGEAGNNNVDLGYLHLDYLSGTNTYISTASGSSTSTTLSAGGSDKIAANPNLKWETTTTRDLGIDYGFFNDRISGAFDLYWNTTNDLILKYKLSSGGYNYQYRNIGSTENKGLEFSLNAIILDYQSKNLNYGLTFNGNISHNKQKVTDLGGMDSYTVSTECFSSDNITTTEFLVEDGGEIGNIYGFLSDGWYKASDFSAYNYSSTGKDTWTLASGVVTPYSGIYNGTTAYPGLIKLKDINGDGKVTDDDKTIIGNTMADFTGGFSLSGNVGNDKIGTFDVAANFTYSYGNDVLNLNRLDYSTILTGSDNTSYRNTTSDFSYGKRYSLFSADGTYLPETLSGSASLTGDSYAKMAAQLDAANANATVWSPYQSKYVVTDYEVEDGSFLRFASLTIGYSLPDRIIKKALLTKARFFFTASNLFCWTNYSGFDPEVDTRSSVSPLASGVDFSAYPKSRAFNFGVNLSF